MNAPRPIKYAVRGMGRNALDLPVAALAGLAVVFVVVAVPADFLSAIVNGTGVPSLIPAAAPPLGLTARICVGIAGAIGTFGLVYLLLRLLDRTGLEKVPVRRPVATDDEAPKLRRRDVHPDAPGRRPISAARDLGEPAPPRAPKAPPPPIWLAEAEPEVEVAVEPAPPPEPAPEPQPELVIEPEPRPEPVPAPASSLAELMERLERGLARRESRPAPAAAPQVFPEARDDRLQSAIDSLQRLASRQS